MIDRPGLRNAYVSSEVTTALAHQIRVIRLQRGWSQKELARRLGTTQAAVSRLEDPSYGKLTLQTLLHLSQVFDTGLQVRFVSLVNMLRKTWQPSREAMKVDAFADESSRVGFVASATKGDMMSNTFKSILAPARSLMSVAPTTTTARAPVVELRRFA